MDLASVAIEKGDRLASCLDEIRAEQSGVLDSLENLGLAVLGGMELEELHTMLKEFIGRAVSYFGHEEDLIRTTAYRAGAWCEEQNRALTKEMAALEKHFREGKPDSVRRLKLLLTEWSEWLQWGREPARPARSEASVPFDRCLAAVIFVLSRAKSSGIPERGDGLEQAMATRFRKLFGFSVCPDEFELFSAIRRYFQESRSRCPLNPECQEVCLMKAAQDRHEPAGQFPPAACPTVP